MALNDANSQLDKIVTELQRLNRAIAANSTTASSSTGGGRSYDTRTTTSSRRITHVKREYDGKLSDKPLSFLRKGLKDVSKELDELGKSARRERTNLHELYNSQTKLIKTIVSHDKVLNSLQDKMTHSIQDQLKGMSFLGKGVMEMAGTMRDITTTLEESEDLLKDFNDGLDEVGKATIDEIRTKKDFIKFYGKMQHHLALDAKKSAEIQALIDKGKVGKAKELIKQEVENAKQIRDVTAHVSSRYYLMSRTVTGVTQGLKKLGDAAGVGFLGQMTTVGGSLGLLGMGLKQAYTELWSVAGAGLGGAYGLMGDKVRSSTHKLGISIDAFAKTFQQNANVAATMGFNGFVNVLKDNQRGLMKLGLKQEEAAKATAAFTQNARASGVNLRDSNAVNKSVRQQARAFETMRAITGVTAEEYASQNKSLLESSAMQESLTRLDKSKRQQTIQDIMMTRERLALMGMTNEQQLEFIKTLKSADVASVEDRFKTGGDLVTAFSALGRGDMGMEAYNLAVNGQLSSERGIELLKYLKDNAQNAKGQGNLGLENLMNKTIDPILAKLGGDQLAAANVNGANAPTKGEVQAAKELGRVPDKIVDITEAIGKMQQMLSDPLWKIVAGITGILGFMVMRFGGGLIKKGILSLGKKFFGVDRKPGGPGLMSRAGSAIRSGAAVAGSAIKTGATVAGGALRSGATVVGGTLRSGASAAGGAIRSGASAAGSMLGSIGSKFASMGGLGMLGKVAGVGLKAVPFIGWAYAAGSAIYDGFKAVEKANEIFGTDAATTSQKIAAGIGGAINSLTFGLLPTDSVAKFVDNASTAAQNIGSVLFGGVSKIFNSILGVHKRIISWVKDKTGINIPGIVDKVTTVAKRAATVATTAAYNFSGTTPKFSGEVNGAINSAASKNGVDPAMMRTMAMIESSGRTDAVSSTGAKGLYQFVGGTAKQYGISGNEFNANANADAAARLFKDNQKVLASRGIDPNGVNTYLAHQLGAGGASALIKAVQTGTDVTPSLRKAMDLNGGKGLSPSQFYQMWTEKYNRNYALANAGVNGSPAATQTAAISPAVAKPNIGAGAKPIAVPTGTQSATNATTTSKSPVVATGSNTATAAAAVATSATTVQPGDKLDALIAGINELVALAREQNILGKASMQEQRVANLQTSFSGTGPSAAADVAT